MVYAMEIALREKMKEMELKGKLEVAKNMLNAGMDMEQISIFTEIPVKELQSLLQNLRIERNF
ncbi:MAG: hypothetical protein HPY74_20380 [Firmicutes bacterium]|nr:hypothetical protein [Bacillota bacterium]